jgi:FkbM family methyltransferase
VSGLFKKVATGVRVVGSPELWRVAAAEALCHGRGRNGGGAVARGLEVTTVADEPASGMKQVEVGGRRYWEPRTMDTAALAGIHAEVFLPDHPHYYEFRECRVKPGDVVVDAGASEGFFTRFALDRGARVLAVEPWAEQAEALRRTFAAEIAEGRVAVHQVALSDHEGAVTLEVDPVAPWGATVGKAYNASVRQSVPLTTLDRLLERSWGRCDFLKADVEGAEAGLVRGATETLRRDRPRVSVAVYHGVTNYLDVRDVLRSLRAGYRVTGKGHHRFRFVVVPVLLHAWVDD